MPPAPGMIPRRVSGRPTRAVEEKTRREVQRASSRPPPKAVLLIAEIVGMGRVLRRVKVARRVVRKVLVLLGGLDALAFVLSSLTLVLRL